MKPAFVQHAGLCSLFSRLTTLECDNIILFKKPATKCYVLWSTTDCIYT